MLPAQTRDDVGPRSELPCLLHDLANTAAGVQGLLRLLKSDGYREDLLAMACVAASHLVEEVEDVRGWLQQRMDHAPAAPIRLRDVLDALRSDGCGLATILGRPLLVEPGPDVAVRADMRLLRRVLVNLVKNALEACPAHGVVRVTARAEAAGIRILVHHPGTLATIPADGGRAIPERWTDRGWGLISVRRIMARTSSGRVDWASSPDAGTSFWIDLMPGD